MRILENCTYKYGVDIGMHNVSKGLDVKHRLRASRIGLKADFNIMPFLTIHFLFYYGKN